LRGEQPTVSRKVGLRSLGSTGLENGWLDTSENSPMEAYDGQESNPSNGSWPNPALRLSAHQNDVEDDQRRGLAS
jgi:hypothetical protein